MHYLQRVNILFKSNVLFNIDLCYLYTDFLVKLHCQGACAYVWNFSSGCAYNKLRYDKIFFSYLEHTQIPKTKSQKPCTLKTKIPISRIQTTRTPKQGCKK